MSRRALLVLASFLLVSFLAGQLLQPWLLAARVWPYTGVCEAETCRGMNVAQEVVAALGQARWWALAGAGALLHFSNKATERTELERVLVPTALILGWVTVLAGYFLSTATLWRATPQGATADALSGEAALALVVLGTLLFAGGLATALRGWRPPVRTRA